MLSVVAHKVDTNSGARYWFDVQGDLDSCGHRHEQRIEAAQCKREMIAKAKGESK